MPATVRRVVIDLGPRTELLRLLEGVHLLCNVRILVVSLAALGLQPTLAPLELDSVVVGVVIRAACAEATVLQRHFDLVRH